MILHRRHHPVVKCGVSIQSGECQRSTGELVIDRRRVSQSLVRNLSRLRQRLRIASIVTQCSDQTRPHGSLFVALAGLRFVANFLHGRSQILAQPHAIGIAIAVAHQVLANVVEPSQNILHHRAVAVGLQALREGEIVAHWFAPDAHRCPDVALHRNALGRSQLGFRIARQRPNRFCGIARPVVSGRARVRENPVRATRQRERFFLLGHQFALRGLTTRRSVHAQTESARVDRWVLRISPGRCNNAAG